MHIIEVHNRETAASFQQNGSTNKLDRAKWHKQLVSIVVTHFNYSNYIEDALLALLDQTHSNWECVVVDDCSDPEHCSRVEAIIKTIGDDRIRFFPLKDNVGQTLAFYAGLDQTSGEFICLLDPDDRYAETFLEESLRAHLNPVIYCPIVASDQFILRKDAVITGIYGRFNMRFLKNNEVPNQVPSALSYIPAKLKGWHWTSTSSMMFRRPVLEFMRPRRPLSHKSFTDEYLAPGAHMLGGSLYLNRPLVYRVVHTDNLWLSDQLFASAQDKRRPDASEHGRRLLAEAIENIIANGGERHLAKQELRRNPLKRWRASVQKRWRRLMGR